ncbi:MULTISPECIES: iron-containing alcohol dehydrogenase [unclassified Schlesneria]|uniref:iron-containing alcohol dehydrogenase n=1 Tax=Schlesneria TaxID=656899 RepID=UPI00359F7AF2
MPAVNSAVGLDLLPPFDFDPRTRVVFGSGTVAQLGQLAKDLGGTRVLFVTDPGIEKAGHAARGVSILNESGLSVALFHDVQPNPTTDDVDHGLQIARDHQIDLIVAMGGGSAMDCAKGINFLLTNGGQMRDYWGVGKATKPMLPSIAIPTTSGTGSEAQSFALIADAKTHMKMACGDKKASCRVAILDPDLTLSMPAGVTSATGIDAISHALESYVTTKRNAISQLFARRAWRLLAQAFPIVTSIAAGNSSAPGTNGEATGEALVNSSLLVAARGNMLLGSHLAGAAIENSMLGATHALANPLTAHFDVTHGLAIGVMLPHVMRYNSSVVGSSYGRLAADVGICDVDDPEAGEKLANAVRKLTSAAGLPSTLRSCQVDRSMLPVLAEEAAKQWTGTFNPRPVNAASLLALYEAAFE